MSILFLDIFHPHDPKPDSFTFNPIKSLDGWHHVSISNKFWKLYGFLFGSSRLIMHVYNTEELPYYNDPYAATYIGMLEYLPPLILFRVFCIFLTRNLIEAEEKEDTLFPRLFFHILIYALYSNFTTAVLLIPLAVVTLALMPVAFLISFCHQAYLRRRLSSELLASPQEGGPCIPRIASDEQIDNAIEKVKKKQLSACYKKDKDGFYSIALTDNKDSNRLILRLPLHSLNKDAVRAFFKLVTHHPAYYYCNCSQHADYKEEKWEEVANEYNNQVNKPDPILDESLSLKLFKEIMDADSFPENLVVLIAQFKSETSLVKDDSSFQELLSYPNKCSKNDNGEYIRQAMS